LTGFSDEVIKVLSSVVTENKGRVVGFLSRQVNQNVIPAHF